VTAGEFEFQGTAHRNSREMHEAIAEDWLSAGGTNTTKDIYQLLNLTDDTLAIEAAKGFGLDGHPSFNSSALRNAFAQIRSDLENRFPAD
jgi:hypothetical protein